MDTEDSASKIGVDLFFSAQYGRLKAMGEFFADTNEMSHIERIQFGFSPRPGFNIWAGRYHNPIGYWNLQFHHGSYLQTTISRPGIIEFTHEGGILGLHLYGLFIELAPKDVGAGFSIKASVGRGPSIDFAEDHPLEEWDLLSSKEEAHGLSSTVRLSYRPDFKEDEFGLFYNRSHIKREEALGPHRFEEINQTIFGFFSHFGAGPATVTGALFFIENDFSLNGAGREVDSFASGYIQVESLWRSEWTFYLRGEATQSDDDDLYLSLFHSYIKERGLAGVRYEITKRQALKLEFSNYLRMDQRINRAVIQWSAAFP